MIVPRSIKPGDLIRIVSTSGKVAPETVLQTVDWLKENGYRVETGKHVFSKHYQFAGTDRERLHDLQLALDDPDCSAILCSRGGYGNIRLMAKLDFTHFLQYPKWLAGYSDITILLAALSRKEVSSIHGSMASSFFDQNGQANSNLHSLMNLLEGKPTEYKIKGASHNKTGMCSGQLIGGNLSILCSLMGTPWEIDTRGKILLVEEINEYRYQVDRMMHQLRYAGKLKDLSGLIVGDFTDIRDNPEPFEMNVREIIQNCTRDYSFPVAFEFPAGHGKLNLAVSLGQNWRLEVEESYSKLALNP